MIRALENNTLGLVLAAICGVFALVTLWLLVLWALPPGAGPGEADAEDADLSADITSLQSARPLEEYAVVSQRPVFNEDRQPVPVTDLTQGPPEPIEPGGQPDVQLAGVIITPTLKMATLRSPEHERSLVAFEGKPLEGNFGTWQVSRIDERMVTLASADGEEMQLELQVHDAMIKEPPKPAKPAESAGSEAEQEAAAEAQEGEDSEPMTRAEQIRQRIEERREELRRAAEERDEAQAQSYSDAIQSMIQKSQNRTQEQQAEEDQ